MNGQCTRLLLAGEYICDVRYPNEFEILQDELQQEQIDGWLAGINMRLARLNETGAFFMAPLVVTSDDHARLRRELLDFRDVYGPAIVMLDLIRQADSLGITLSPGEYIPLYELEQAVVNQGTLEMLLRTKLAVINEGNPRNSVRENLRRLLMHLAKDGYVFLASKETETYRVTGKIEQLYAVLQFLSENRVIPDTDVDESEIEDPDLIDLANAEEDEP
ncbi:hypothetical protein KW835_14130 [Acidovorax sp. sic0104]|uniref:condensin complex protein MksE n=1 Tax=Acidovorax sp. sic0104 TaxID=2854784 RepID=UPI0030D7A1B7|nr:hypothetical protein [Acidovorax sp. sic0104]